MYIRDNRQPLQLNKELEICGEIYTPYALIGRGGHYLCYLAKHGEDICVLKQFYPKELRPEYAENSHFFRVDDYTAKRFLSLYGTEAERAAQNRSLRFIDNRGNLNNNPLVILPEYLPAEQNSDGICAFAVSECYSGLTLRQALEEKDSFGRTPRERVTAALNLTKGLARALQSMHDRRIIHGDISPDNIYLRGVDAMGVSEYEVLLIDFGSFLLLDDNGHLADGQEAYVTSSIIFGAPELLSVVGRRNGAGVGNAEYRSAVENIGVRSDLFSAVQIFMNMLAVLSDSEVGYISPAVMSRLSDILSLTACEQREILDFVSKYIKRRPQDISCEGLIKDIDGLVDLLNGRGCSADIIRRFYELKYASFSCDTALLPQLEYAREKKTFPELMPSLSGRRYVFTGTSGGGKTTSLLSAMSVPCDEIIPIYIPLRYVGKNQTVTDYAVSELGIDVCAFEQLIREDSSHRYVILADGLNEAMSKAWELNRLASELPVTLIVTSTYWPGYDRDSWVEIKSLGVAPQEDILNPELRRLLTVPFYRFLYDRLSWSPTDKALKYNLQSAFVKWKASMFAEDERAAVLEFLPAIGYNMMKQNTVDIDNTLIYAAVSDSEPFAGKEVCFELISNRQAGAIIDFLRHAGFVEGTSIHNRWVEFFAARYIADCAAQGADIKWDGHLRRRVLQLIWETVLGEERIADSSGKMTVSAAKLTKPFLKTPGIFELLTRSTLEHFHNGTDEKEAFSKQLVKILNRYRKNCTVSYDELGLLLAQVLRRAKDFDAAIEFSTRQLQAGILPSDHRNNIAKVQLLTALEHARQGYPAEAEYSAAIAALIANWENYRIPECGSLYAFMLAFPDPVSAKYVASDCRLSAEIFFDIAKDRRGPWKYALGQVAALLINCEVRAHYDCCGFDRDPDIALEEILDCDIEFTAQSPDAASSDLAMTILDVLGPSSPRKMLKALALLRQDRKNLAAAEELLSQSEAAAAYFARGLITGSEKLLDKAGSILYNLADDISPDSLHALYIEDTMRQFAELIGIPDALSEKAEQIISTPTEVI